jgi:hypothetical protein
MDSLNDTTVLPGAIEVAGRLKRFVWPLPQGKALSSPSPAIRGAGRVRKACPELGIALATSNKTTSGQAMAGQTGGGGVQGKSISREEAWILPDADPPPVSKLWG